MTTDYLRLCQIGEVKILVKFEKITKINAIDCFYDQEDQENALPVLAILHNLMRHDKHLINLFVHHYFSLPQNASHSWFTE
tara:strand:- start:1780 stop:2022 length:243 start_codon:yes stop_codon:yes gene_type:complete